MWVGLPRARLTEFIAKVFFEVKTRIRNVQYFRAVSPSVKPIADATHAIPEISFVITRVELESGVIGESNLLAFHYSPQAIAGALRDIRPIALEFEAWETGKFLNRVATDSEYFGRQGINRWAAGAINVAMWDAWARNLEQPVWKLFGACRDKVPVYGSGGWLSYSVEELLEETRAYVRRGFAAVKIKVGSSELERDVERIARVREAIGPNIKIMIDANQGMNVVSALELARKAESYNLHCFEEPISNTDFAGYAHLRGHCGIPLAMGEREYDTIALRELMTRNALDIWQPDILRLGGVEGWRGSALQAQCNGLRVQPHYYKEYDVPLLCTIENGYCCESFDWIDPLVDRPMHIRDGFATPAPGPGWGFRFKDEYLTELV